VVRERLPVSAFQEKMSAETRYNTQGRRVIPRNQPDNPGHAQPTPPHIPHSLNSLVNVRVLLAYLMKRKRRREKRRQIPIRFSFRLRALDPRYDNSNTHMISVRSLNTMRLGLKSNKLSKQKKPLRPEYVWAGSRTPGSAWEMRLPLTIQQLCVPYTTHAFFPH
jgi:hypothetical protein